MTDDLVTISELAEYAHVGRGSVYIMLRKGRFKGHKVAGRWRISKTDYDAYRMSRHSGEDRRKEGVRIFNMDEGRFSVQMTAKILGERLGKRFNTMGVYYQIRRGRLKAYRIGTAWIVSGEAIQAYVDRVEDESDDAQLRFV
jgi:excisionase family DNA binding protein